MIYIVLKELLRQLLSLLLPFSATVVVPVVLLSIANSTEYLWNFWPIPFLIFGVILLIPGIIVLVMCISRFIVKGKGTLAPWSPPRKLVTDGLYRYVRNPMISGVLLIMAGEAVVFRSWLLLLWFAVFFAINHVYFLLFEEPALQKRFGVEYIHYKNTVPRWIPDLRKIFS